MLSIVYVNNNKQQQIIMFMMYDVWSLLVLLLLLNQFFSFNIISTSRAFVITHHHRSTSTSSSSSSFTTPPPPLNNNIKQQQTHNYYYGYDHGYGHVDRSQTKKKISNVCLYMNWFDRLMVVPKKESAGKGGSTETKATKEERLIEILDYDDDDDVVGWGSYGIIYKAKFVDNDDEDHLLIAKRAWTIDELKEQQNQKQTTTKTNISEENNGNNKEEERKRNQDQDDDEEEKDEENKKKQILLESRAERCRYYLDVEQHCGTKISSSDSNNVPKYLGKYKDNNNSSNKKKAQQQQHEWLVFEMIHRSISRTSLSGKEEKKKKKIDNNVNNIQQTVDLVKLQPARSLKAVMDLDWIDQHNNQHNRIDEVVKNDNDSSSQQQQNHHHLYMIQKEFQMDETATTFDDVLDMILEKLLQSISSVHNFNIVHRDIKPSNILIDGSKQEFVIIDFGSAQDVDIKQNMMFLFNGEATIALSPIYAPPGSFDDWEKAPLNFDGFSIGLIFCQLLFNLLDDRTDAGFRQQLDDANYDINLWLERELQATLRPAGLEDGLKYLGRRPGVWGLLEKMLEEDAEKRISSQDALNVVRDILSNNNQKKNTVQDRIKKDGAYFDYVIQDLDICPLSPELLFINADEDIIVDEETMASTIPRPLHYVATFGREESLGLILAEADVAADDDENNNQYKYENKWRAAIIGASKGDVFVRDIVVGGQAERIGVIEIGDRVSGVGEFPHQRTGFEGFVSMLEAVPRNSKALKIHFDRKAERVVENEVDRSSTSSSKSMKVSSHGAWQMQGRRKTQEDMFVLHEIHEIQSNENSILLSGVFDGHGGDSASKSAQQLLPVLLSSELCSKEAVPLELALDVTWDSVCDSYREGCSLLGSGCVADYDAREGILYASTGSKELVAGSTATVSALRINADGTISDIVVLNCGDSRTIVAGEFESSKEGSLVHFVTRDHVPSCPHEDKRLRANEQFSHPQCSMNKYWLTVGDYRYALSRSLEGSFATSKGIINESDISKINVEELADSRTYNIIIQASDGLFEVLDNEEVARKAVDMRKDGLCAKDCAKALCRMAVKKNTSDNVSVVVVYLE